MISKRDPRKTEMVRRLLAPVETWRPAAAWGKAETAPGDLRVGSMVVRIRSARYQPMRALADRVPG
ncbi:hypothetical protein WMF27_17675 [Sorangium sp. So ce281]|uniref:hypothetical protein n=1 Tax=Sorangium sp. So ce281 TaxID=3133293 RepID=UPI003F61E023